MLIDERRQDLKRRSSSAWAKNALATLRISLARRSSLTSRSRPSAVRVRQWSRHRAPLVNLITLDPFVQRLRRTPNHRRNRLDRCPHRRMFGGEAQALGCPDR
ncbi:UNVERIFIED_ORG: hypothetical protein J2811_005310 [Burkholderia cepacia]|nr:hypothetical protein [Burkholderia cepacia]MDP9597340.1 hypothetical protein [Burkholderia cepacia]MDP9625841.1 hypothetical protein [Burkholderia cepacia]MDP9671770.1 hypothetical protein [Burkholderia cepacia]MDP9718043.1 hypothetical protein [Burkholderia cepacia]